MGEGGTPGYGHHLCPQLPRRQAISRLPKPLIYRIGTVIPSKLFESMGMGLPVLMSLPEGEATGIVRQTGVGVVVPPERPQQLADAVVDLSDHPDRMRTLQDASLAAAPLFSRPGQAAKMLAVFEAVVQGKGHTVGD